MTDTSQGSTQEPSRQDLAAQPTDLPPPRPGALPGPDPSTSPSGYVHVADNDYRPILVHFGNDAALEAYKDAESDNPELTRFREQSGQQVTTVGINDREGELDLFKRVERIMTSLGYHFRQGAGPRWIEIDPGSHDQQEADDILNLLHMRFGTKEAQRPEDWGASNPPPSDAPPAVSAAPADDAGGAQAQVIPGGNA